MHTDLSDLYQEVILDHSKQPRNYRELDGASNMAKGHNPLCGDKIDIYLKLEEGLISDISFQGSGCAISTASASMMTESLKGKNLEDAERLVKLFHGVVTGQNEDTKDLGKLTVFAGVQQFPVRVKCATLAWHTLKAALDNREEEITTE